LPPCSPPFPYTTLFRSVANASRRLAIVVDGAKLVDRLGSSGPVPVEVVAFGLEATRATLEVLGASVRPRLSPAGEPFVTDSGNRDRKSTRLNSSHQIIS